MHPPLSNSPLNAGLSAPRWEVINFSVFFIIFIICLRRSPEGGGGVHGALRAPCTPWEGRLPSSAPYPGRVRVCAEAAGDSLIYFHPPAPGSPLSNSLLGDPQGGGGGPH
uniref:Uncharacterized protein n=1 Tax=Morchella brunnea TaxID=1174671 RepID=A0A8K1I7B7_9PEZI|nr:hypothetical protein LK370_mgp086 [Morchella brunnea]UBU98397.1 hypothetical protein [Morchella brunnea]